MKIVHAADIHLDSPLRGLKRHDDSGMRDQIRNATRNAFENLVDLCIKENARLLLIAGDLYDGDWRDYNTALFFAKQIGKLCNEAGIVTILVRGNHDAENPLATKSKLSGTGIGANHSFRLNDKFIELRTDQPETRIIEHLGVAVHGQSFGTKAVTQDLASKYPNAIGDLFNIGLLHTSVSGHEGHENYAPCKLQTLIDKGYDYWALGHVHKRMELNKDPWIVFPGNLQGRHVRETGEKGATVITVEDGRVKDVAHRTLDAVRWAQCSMDIGQAGNADDVVERTRDMLAAELKKAGDRPLAARVILSGSGKAHAQLAADPEVWGQRIWENALTLPGEGVWIEKIKVKTRAAVDVHALMQQQSAIGQLLQGLHELRNDEAALTEFVRPLLHELRLPIELKSGDEALRLDQPALLRSLLEDVEQLLIPLLIEGGAPR